ncbi:MAG TPA: ABC transporter ATP-binding protein [Candidatus Baltobacteraceae bacterium]|nr:ABC transporter ATP-binding protein [Candidatus Baltobacteraceae bacterium]
METVNALELRGIRKTFGSVVALDGVDLDLQAGEVHALVGENGAGKSTLASIAFGTLKADSGTVRAAGTVGLVHQHFELVGRLRVWQNVVLGREPKAGWSIDARTARAQVLELAQKNALDVDPDAFVDELPVGAQQRVELLRELYRDPVVLLLDEPTAALAPAEIGRFFETVRALAARGTAVMVVTHKLQEVMEYSQRVSVLRRGRMVAQYRTSETNVAEIAHAMVGGEPAAVASRQAVPLRPCLRVLDLTAVSASSGVERMSLHVDGGEIVGIAGVEGNGQTALADALAGLVPFRGSIEMNGTAGIIPQDRRAEGLVLDWSLAQNVVLGRQRRVRRGIVVDRARARADAQTIVERFDVRAPSLDAPVRALSGGNQQKLLAGRALIDRPAFVLAYQPTRGIDVGAAALVQSRLIEARNAGAAVLLISFDLDEILAIADRVLVMYRGRIAGEFASASADRAAIGRLMAGAAA